MIDCSYSAFVHYVRPIDSSELTEITRGPEELNVSGPLTG